MSQLSEHFSLAELTHTNHREFDNTPNEQELANLIRLAEFLELVKTALGGKPIMVNSAFRSKQVNDSVGSKDTSQHRLGCAADIRVPGLVLTKWYVKSLPLGWAWIRSSGSLTHGLMCQFQALKTRRQGCKRLSLTSQEPGFLHNSNANSW